MKYNSYSSYSTNVNFIKFIAAVMVILSHSFPLASGTMDNEWFNIITNGQYTMGGVAVCVFFFYSGLLVSKSLEKSTSAKQYFMKRVIRIIPPLAAVVILSTFIMGPIVTTLPIYRYFVDPRTYLYLLNSILILVHDLPGVFENNSYLSTVNGSLWTLPVEAVCYVACFLLFKLKLHKKLPMKILLVLSILFDILFLILSKQMSLGMIYSMVLPVLMFFAGIFYYIFRDSIKMDYRFLIIAILVIIISNFSGTLLLGLYLGFPYILAYTGFCCKRIPELLGNLGKISYGIYLCAFPIQQCLVWSFGGTMNIYGNMLMTLPLSMIVGWFLYEFMEKRLLTHKQK